MKYSFEEKKRKIGVAATLVFVCVLGIVYLMSGHVQYGKQKNLSESEFADNSGDADYREEREVPGGEETGEAEPEIAVHVCGAVVNPGVYRLDGDARIEDAVTAAGGFSKNADRDYLNLAENISDGQKITVYTRKQTKRFKDSGTGDGETGGSALIDINRASREELMTLPGIGEAKADDIISYREAGGGFKSTEELMNVPGIKEGVYSKISGMITVGG